MEDYSETGTTDSALPQEPDHLAEARRVFEAQPRRYGELEAPTKEGLVWLVRAGKDVWNTWRAAYPEVPADFSGLTFPAEWGIDFSGLRFPNIEGNPCVDFSNCTFDGTIKLDAAIFGERAIFFRAKFYREISINETFFNAESDFSETSFFLDFHISKSFFAHSANFASAIFHKSLTIRNTNFDPNVDFSKARFNSLRIESCRFGAFASFIDAFFQGPAEFTGTSFDPSAHFIRCNFSNSVSFSSIYFGTAISFLNAEFSDTLFLACVFNGTANLFGAKFNRRAYFNGTTFRARTIFAGKGVATSTQSNQFDLVSFAGTTFFGDVHFDDREFKSTADFGPLRSDIKPEGRNDAIPSGTPVHFHGIASFHGCKFHQDTSFDGAKFLAPPSPEAARAYRTLKLAMEQLKATREEQKFFRLEMKAEHPSLHWSRRWISTLYALCSDYGFSLWRPFVTLVVCMLAFGAMFGGMANAYADATNEIAASEVDWNRTSQWFRYILINTFPVPGLDKAQLELRDALFGKDGGIVTAAMALEMLHKLISIGCAFLLGLALRNLFKMKS